MLSAVHCFLKVNDRWERALGKRWKQVERKFLCRKDQFFSQSVNKSESKGVEKGRGTPDGEVDEKRLIELARAGSMEGWEELHRLYYKGLWSAVNRVLNDDMLAEDVVSEAFIKAYKRLDRFRGDSKFSTWIYRIAMNQAYDAVRKRSRRQKWLGLFPLENEEEELVHEPVTEVDASDYAHHGDQRRALQEALGQLKPEQRSVVELRLIQGFSTEETARILGVKRGTVLSRLFYSCQKLRQILEKDYDEL